MDAPQQTYAARLDVDYPEKLDRLTTAFRFLWIIPIAIVLSVLSATATSTTTVVTASGEVLAQISRSAGGIVGALFGATLLLILFRQRYPRWWFDFALQFHRFSARVGTYGALLTDRYPSTVDEQSVHLDLDYPDAEPDLNRWLPLVKWFLAIPHYVVLFFLFIGAFRGRHRLVRHPVHRPVSAWPVRLRRRRGTVDAAGRGVCHPVGHRPLPAIQPALIRTRGLRSSQPTPQARPGCQTFE